MLSRRYRLTSRRVFNDLARRGRRRSGQYILVRALAARSGPTRVAVAMGTKAAKLAVVRNRHKRVVRALVRSLLPKLPSGWQIAMTIRRPATAPAEWVALQEEVRTLLANLSSF